MGEGADSRKVDLIKRRGQEVQGQEQYNRIQISRYNERYKYIRTSVRAEYLEKEGRGGSQKLIARARCGNLEEWNKYWLDEESRRCVLCKQGRGTLKHLVEDCVEIERCKLRLEQIVEGSVKEEVVRWLADVEKEMRERRARGGERGADGVEE